MPSFFVTIETQVFHLFRNTAVDTVDQQLLFVGTENGKLVAMRDIIKKVRSLLDFKENRFISGYRINIRLNHF